MATTKRTANPVRVGSMVTCAYRASADGVAHVGEVLAVDDPRAWAGTIAFPSATPDPVEVAMHVERHAATVCDLKRVPVLYSFGVRWDSSASLSEVNS